MTVVTVVRDSGYLADPHVVQNSADLAVEPLVAGGGFGRLGDLLRTPARGDDPARSATSGGRLAPAVDAQVARSGADGRTKEPSRGFLFAAADLVGAAGQPQFHLHVGVPNTTVSDTLNVRAEGNARDSLMRAAPELNALIQDVDALLRARGGCGRNSPRTESTCE